MDVGDADTLERGALLAPPSPLSPSSSSSPSKAPTPPSPPHTSHGPSVAWQILWSVAFYAPSAALPLAARLLVVYRDEALVAFGSLLRGAVFGGLQDAAVLCQTLLMARIILRLRDALVTSRACYRNLLVYTTCFVALALAYMWMTLACLVDLSLLLNFLPRLNRGFVTMYMEFAGQFASSLKDAVTANMVVGVCVYAMTMVLWIVALLGDKVKLPAFGIPFRSLWQSSSTPATRASTPSTPSATKPSSIQVGPQHSAASSVWTLRAIVTSLTVRTLCVSLLVSVAALHATLALDGNGSDIYFFSNAMFSLEAEPFLKTAQVIQGTTTQDKDARVLHFESCIERVIGPSESFLPADAGRHRDRYPLWRKTLTYKGDKRFEIHTRRGTPPNIILLNIESMRGREIGVIGGRDKKAQFNQTATPFFDKLSTQGVLFRQHYTPSIQTSRTLMSSLFGVLPSYTDATAVAKSYKTKTRLHGLPQILKESLQYTTVFWSAVDLAWDHWREFFQRNGFDQLWDDKGVLTHLTQAQRDALTNEDSFSWGYHDPVSFAGLENFLEKRRTDRETTPLFLDVYSITSHDPFPTPPRFSPSSNYSAFVNKHNAGYVDALNFVDQQLQKLITNLRAKKLLDNTILLIEGDHGYGRMEHGNNPTIASSRVYDEATHIPLLIIADDLLREQDKGMVIDDVSSQTDLLATVADMVGLRGFMQHGVGQSLVRKPPPVATTKEEETNMRGVIVENPYDGGTIGLRVGPDLKYVRYHSGKYFIFNLTSDPEELAPIEQGDVNDGLKDDVTKAQLLYATQVVDMTQFMYETDGFMLPPQLANKKKTGGGS